MIINESKIPNTINKVPAKYRSILIKMINDHPKEFDRLKSLHDRNQEMFDYAVKNGFDAAVTKYGKGAASRFSQEISQLIHTIENPSKYGNILSGYGITSLL